MRMFYTLTILVIFIISNQTIFAKPIPELKLQQRTFHLGHLLQLQNKQYKASNREYYEYLRTTSMSSGIDVINKGGIDPQQPHTSDEIYYIINGSGSIKIANQSRSVKTGDLIYVAKNIPHHFYDITAKLIVLVMMAPPEQTPNILFLYDKHLNNQEIANILNVDINTVSQIVKKYKELGHL